MLWIIVAFVAGYVAAAFTWQWVHTLLIGVEEKAKQLRDSARALEQKLRGA
jgi:hypothetical protein